MNIAVVQFAPILGQPKETRERVLELSQSFAGPELVVLPELANSGYAFTSREQALALSEVPEASPFVDLLVEICARNHQHIVTGFHERQGDSLYNSALLLGPDGVEGKYRKLHLFLNEKDIFEPGDLGLSTFEVAGVRLGMLICFDWRFPEVWRALALEGVDLICHPSNLVTRGLAQRVTPVHALLNRVYVATANRVGREGAFTFTGVSQIVDPFGNVLAQAGDAEETVCQAALDPAQARDKMANARNDLFADRRPEYYRKLAEPC
jgi:predicted amidohydrolase